jgi:lipopolysaccharide/colanic/teichoic acid biosynthesis glycosyltransferase
MSALSAQRIYQRALYVAAPGATAAAMVLQRTGDLGQALVVLAALLATGMLMWPDLTPMHLMPIASNALRLSAPIAGTALVLSPGLVSRDWPLDPVDMTGPLVGALLIVVLARFLERRFASGAPVRLAVIGPRELATKLDDELRANGIATYRVVGYITPDRRWPKPRAANDEISWLGSLDDVREAVIQHGVHLMAVGPDTPRLHVFEEAARACLDLPVRMIEANALYEQVLGHVPIGSINSAWFQCIMHPRYTPSAPATKRALDLAVAIPACLLGAILLPLIALLIKREDRGPLFFHQRRVGEQGRDFDMIKFRTMQPDADRQREAGVPEEQLITRTGRLLRLTHLNELPQLLNVLRGDMTIVGPRPEPPDLVRALGQVVPYYERRALVKPGLTGWAQVRCGYAGDQVGTAWKMCHDLFYVKHRSVAFDILIMLQTLHVLVETPEQEYERPHEEFILGEMSSVAGR